jgi:sirohydrochlorin cobaltochelatase
MTRIRVKRGETFWKLTRGIPAIAARPEVTKDASPLSGNMQALVIVGHGSHLNPGSSDPAFAHADTIRESGAFDEVREAFWKEEPSFRNALRTLESDEVYVVPLFISEGYFTEQVIPRELRLDDWDPEDWDSDGTDADHATLDAGDVDKTIHYCGPVGTHDSMSDVIVQRARSVTGRDEFGDGFGLAVVGHGTERNENSAKAIYYHADRIAERGDFEEVQAVFMDEDPEVDDVTDFFETEDIVVVPLFVSDGFHTQEDIPEDMGLTDDYRTGYPTPADVDGHRIWYSGAVGTEPLVADVILERAADAGAPVHDAVEEVRERTGGADAAAGD